jgi:hypothetical protein
MRKIVSTEKKVRNVRETKRSVSILWGMYETCITIFLEIRATSTSNLAGGYHAGETVPMAVIAMNRTAGALHPGCRRLASAGEGAGAGGGRKDGDRRVACRQVVLDACRLCEAYIFPVRDEERKLVFHSGHRIYK